VVTMGNDGAVGMTPRDRVDVPGTPVAVSDTVGAGDSFTSGLLAWLHDTGRLDHARLRGVEADDLREGLAFANRAAAITCTRPGAQPPTRAEMGARPRL
jgi:fructokinase